VRAGGNNSRPMLSPSAKLSVVIPTHNRKAIVRRAIEAYVQQTAREEILEIIVVDDGSTDGTADVVSEIAMVSSIPIRYLRQDKRGPAAARNRGILEANGAITLFTDDDVIPGPNLVEEHLAWHRQHPEANFAVVGFVPWSPEVHPTPLMQWSIRGGPQLYFNHMEHGRPVSYLYCSFGNTSLKTAFLRENGFFNEAFTTWGWEDLELGDRLIRKGMVMAHNVNAVGYHHKYVSFADLCRIPAKVLPAATIAATTEAGRVFFEDESRRKASRQYRLKRLLARLFVPLLAPLKLFLDSPIPLPPVIYRLFYFYYGVLAVEQRQQGIDGSLPEVLSSDRQLT
jgi:glycosyltransferase involved in cell wall biosynthesis